MESSQKPDNVAAVMKVFAVLEGLAEQKEMSLAELAQRTLMSKSTTYRFLQTMKGLGYVRQEGETEKYGLTLKLFELGAGTLEYVDLITLADKEMKKLSEATHEAIHLGMLDDNEQCVIYIHKYDSRFNLCMHSRIGKRNPLYNTGLGKALLAWQDEADVRRRLAQVTFKPFTDNTLPNADAVIDQLPTIRKQGYAVDDEEGEVGVHCLAAPIFDRLGKVIAALSISFPVVRFDQDKREDYVAQLHQAGRQISAGLGYHDYPF